MANGGDDGVRARWKARERSRRGRKISRVVDEA